MAARTSDRRCGGSSAVGVDDVLDLVGRAADRVLGLARRLVDLALVLQALVAGQVAGGFLGAALQVVLRPVTHRGPPASGFSAELNVPVCAALRTRATAGRWRPAPE